MNDYLDVVLQLHLCNFLLEQAQLIGLPDILT